MKKYKQNIDVIAEESDCSSDQGKSYRSEDSNEYESAQASPAGFI